MKTNFLPFLSLSFLGLVFSVIGYGQDTIAPIIAVIDTGVDLSHPCLESALWTNPGESGLDKNGKNRATNGVDDDNNGFIDDVHGWNFAEDNSSLLDQHGHGTHIAGIIACPMTEGPRPEVQMMILKYFSVQASAPENLRHSIQALRYAIQMRARMINYSSGGTGFNAEEFKTLQLAEKNEILVIAAAGNEHRNTDQIPYYPASYALSNVLSVTSISSQKTLSPFSNFGPHSVHLAALGEDIISLLPEKRFGTLSGTSQATARVTHALVRLATQEPWIHVPSELIARLVVTGAFDSKLSKKTISGKTLDLKRALAMKDRLQSALGEKIEYPPNIQEENLIVRAPSRRQINQQLQ